MFLTRVPGFGNTTNLNRKRRRRPSTSPVVGRRSRPSLEALETRQLLSTYACDQYATIPVRAACGRPLSMRIRTRRRTISSSTSRPRRRRPANVPVPGFDPATQTWRINLPVPSQRSLTQFRSTGIAKLTMVACRFAIQAITPAVQSITIMVVRPAGPLLSAPAFPLPANTTVPIPWNAGAGVVQAALGAIVGPGQRDGYRGTRPQHCLDDITFQNAYAQQTIQPLSATSNLTGGTNPGLSVQTVRPGWDGPSEIPSDLHPVDPEHNRRPAGK